MTLQTLIYEVTGSNDGPHTGMFPGLLFADHPAVRYDIIWGTDAVSSTPSVYTKYVINVNLKRMVVESDGEASGVVWLFIDPLLI
jgi:hypothetical protein